MLQNMKKHNQELTLLHSERPKLYTILAFLSAIGLIGDTDYYSRITFNKQNLKILLRILQSSFPSSLRKIS